MLITSWLRMSTASLRSRYNSSPLTINSLHYYYSTTSSTTTYYPWPFALRLSRSMLLRGTRFVYYSGGSDPLRWRLGKAIREIQASQFSHFDSMLVRSLTFAASISSIPSYFAGGNADIFSRRSAISSASTLHGHTLSSSKSAFGSSFLVVLKGATQVRAHIPAHHNPIALLRACALHVGLTRLITLSVQLLLWRLRRNGLQIRDGVHWQSYHRCGSSGGCVLVRHYALSRRRVYSTEYTRCHDAALNWRHDRIILFKIFKPLVLEKNSWN